ncbi:MAG: trehalose-phosphatase [Planctomycetaceae bacterium]|nr:trehalose-phosphatase [Planctomycetaceae bacterium]
MIFEIRKLSDRMCQSHRRGSSLILLFDYDGTLTPIVEQPSLAVLDRHTRQLLANLVERPRVHVGILSSRELADLQPLVAIPGLYMAGNGGLELDLQGLRIVHPYAARFARLVRRVADRLQPSVDRFPGAWIERKRLGLTVHFRRTPNTFHDPLHQGIVDAACEFPGEIRVARGPKAWELFPAKGWDKGMAIRLILADIGADHDILLYAGDGENDRAAMTEVAAMGGITVGVGLDAPQNTAWSLPNPMAVRTLLECLDASLEPRTERAAWPSTKGPRRIRSEGKNAAIP